MTAKASFRLFDRYKLGVEKGAKKVPSNNFKINSNTLIIISLCVVWRQAINNPMIHFGTG